METWATATAPGSSLRGTPLTMPSLTTVTNTTIPAQHWYVAGPSTANAVTTLGYWIQSAQGRFDIFVMSDVDYVKFQNGQPFQYYTAYSQVNAESASFPSTSFTPPTALYLVLSPDPMPVSPVTLWYNVGFFAGQCPFYCDDGGGVCIADGCSCNFGWGGRACANPVCYQCNPDRGSCTAPGVCICNSGWSGPQCSWQTGLSKLSIGLIVGGVILFCAIIGLIWFKRRRSAQHQQQRQPHSLSLPGQPIAVPYAQLHNDQSPLPPSNQPQYGSVVVAAK